MLKSIIENGDRLNIIYFTDPLCCWSWVFEPVWQQLRDTLAPVLTYQYCMGGMLSSWNEYNDTVNAVTRPIQMGPVWLHAKYTSGTYINDRLWFTDPPASSYPACVAVKSAGMQSAAAGELYLYKLREAALVNSKNIARKEVLLEIACEVQKELKSSFNYDLFLKQLTSADIINQFKRDLELVRLHGISRFPSLLIRVEGKKQSVIVTGYRPYEAIMATIEALVTMSDAGVPIKTGTD